MLFVNSIINAGVQIEEDNCFVLLKTLASFSNAAVIKLPIVLKSLPHYKPSVYQCE
eukprot:Pgem_evm1s13337